MLRKALLAALVLVGLYVAATVVLWVVGVITSIVSALISLAVLVGLLYVAYRAGTWLLGGTDEGSTDPASTDDADDPVERLQQQYVEGKITEAEFERRLDREFDGTAGGGTAGGRTAGGGSTGTAGDGDADVDVDRELDRLRSE